MSDTPCKECVFATFSHEKGVRKQVGCMKDMHTQFKKGGYIVQPAYDEECMFDVILNRQCMYFRDAKWMKEKVRGRLVEDVLEEENALEFNVVIPVDKNFSIQRIQDIVNSFINQTKPPSKILIIRSPTCMVSALEAAKLLRATGIPWKVENLVTEPPDLYHHALLFSASHNFYSFNFIAQLPIKTDILHHLQTIIVDGGRQVCQMQFSGGIFVPTSVLFYYRTRHRDIPFRIYIDQKLDECDNTNVKLTWTEEEVCQLAKSL